MKALSCRSLTRRFGDILALDGLDLDVEEGAVFGFLGRNGAGKTTTLRLVTGLARPDGGRAAVFGVDVRSEPLEAGRLFGYLPEDPAFHPWMTARETLAYAGGLHGLSRRECASRIPSLLERLGLERAGDRRVGGFSRGMRQRLGLAAALVHSPPLLLLDEPASALDPAGRKAVLEMIGDLRGKATVFMSTHILSDVERVCDRVAILDRGRLVLEAGMEEILDRYGNPVLEIDFEPARGGGKGGAAMDSLLERLRALSGVEWAAREGPRVRVGISASEGETGNRVLREAMESGLTILRFEALRPSLEDVFLRLTGGEGEA